MVDSLIGTLIAMALLNTDSALHEGVYCSVSMGMKLIYPYTYICDAFNDLANAAATELQSNPS